MFILNVSEIPSSSKVESLFFRILCILIVSFSIVVIDGCICNVLVMCISTCIYLLFSADSVILAGCGKRTVVKYVASRLGLHVVEYNCYNLMASSERKTSIALVEAFKTARRYFRIICC